MHLCRDVRERMNFAKFITGAVVAALAAGCGGSTTTVTEIAGPTAARCQTSIASTPATVPHAGSQITISIVAERECTWTATSEASWAQVAPASGQGQSPLAVTVVANPNASTRSGVIAINDTRLSLTQEAAPCRFQLGSSRSQLSHTGGRNSVSLSAPSGCAWRASSSQGWARVTPDSGSGAATLDIEATPNTGAERTATISIADQTLLLVQEAPPTPPGAGGGSGGGGGGGGGGEGGGGAGGGGGSEEPRIELSGRALLVQGSCPSISFILDLHRVFTNGDTRFRSECRSIRTGTDVRVDGRVQSDGRVRATEVRVRDND
jgi:hypothetical protein